MRLLRYLLFIIVLSSHSKALSQKKNALDSVSTLWVIVPPPTISQHAERFNDSIFRNNATFAHETFQNDIYFNNAKFQGKTIFSNSTFNKPGYFEWATFNEIADFSGASFRDEADFAGAIFQEQLLATQNLINGDILNGQPLRR